MIDDSPITINDNDLTISGYDMIIGKEYVIDWNNTRYIIIRVDYDNLEIFTDRYPIRILRRICKMLKRLM